MSETARKEGRATTPPWALFLESLGWLITCVGVLPIPFVAFALIHAPTVEALMMGIPLVLGFGFGMACIGGVLLDIARSAQLDPQQSRWRLWAKIFLRFGGLLCLCIPCIVYAIAPAGLQVSRIMDLNGSSNSEISPLDPELIFITLAMGGPGFLLGIILIVPALIWGRRRLRAPDSPVVSN